MIIETVDFDAMSTYSNIEKLFFVSYLRNLGSPQLFRDILHVDSLLHAGSPGLGLDAGEGHGQDLSSSGPPPCCAAVGAAGDADTLSVESTHS